MDAEPAATLYCDGGVVAVNPSPYAGTWAWCAVTQSGRRIAEGSGLLLAPGHDDRALLSVPSVFLWPGTPRIPNAVSNNHSEWVAVVMALEAMPAGWSGRLATDSVVTMHRMLDRQYMDAAVLPIDWWVRGKAALARLGHVERLYVKGHPTRAALAAGHDHKGRYVSVHNVHVDNMCAQAAKLYRLVGDKRARAAEVAWT